MLFELEAAKLGHRLRTFIDRGGANVVQCECGGFDVRVAEDDPNPGDVHDHAVRHEWPKHVIDSTFESTRGWYCKTHDVSGSAVGSETCIWGRERKESCEIVRR